MAMHYPIVFEREDSGVYSAYVAGLGGWRKWGSAVDVI